MNSEILNTTGKIEVDNVVNALNTTFKLTERLGILLRGVTDDIAVDLAKKVKLPESNSVFIVTDSAPAAKILASYFNTSGVLMIQKVFGPPDFETPRVKTTFEIENACLGLCDKVTLVHGTVPDCVEASKIVNC